MSERSLEIWAEPLTDSERDIIEQVKKNGTTEERRMWLGHLLACYDAMTEAEEARVAALTQVAEGLAPYATHRRGCGRNQSVWLTAEGRPDCTCGLEAALATLGGLVGLHEQEQKLSVNQVSPHPFRRRGWRFWICTHCYAPRKLHPRRAWTRPRPLGDNHYLSANAPHFREGW